MIAHLFSRRISDLKDYFLAGRTLGGLSVGLCFAASWFGAGSSMGSVNALHDHGLSGLWDLVIPSVASCTVISLLFAKRVARQNIMSQPEAVEHHYGRLGRFLLSLIILCAVTVLLGSQMVAAGRVFQEVLGLDLTAATLVSTGIVVLYSLMGGYFAVVITDIAQIFLIVLGLGLLAAFTLGWAIQSPEGLAGTLQHTTPGFWTLFSKPGEHAALLVTFVLAWSIAPEMWQRMSSTRNPELAARAAWIGTGMLVALFSLIMVIGLLSPALVGKSPMVLVALAQRMPHEALTALVLIGFFAAVTSTMDSSMNVGSLTLTRDLYQGFFRPQAGMTELLWVSRIATALIVLPAMAIALYFHDIIRVLWMSADIYASTMFFPMIGILFLGNPGRWSGVLAMVFGGVSIGFSALMQHHLLLPDLLTQWGIVLSWPGWPYSTLIGVAMSGLGFSLGYLISRMEVVETGTQFDPVG